MSKREPLQGMKHWENVHFETTYKSIDNKTN